MNEIEQLKQRIADLEYKLNLFVKQDSYVFERKVNLKANKIGFFTTEPITKIGSPTGRQDTSGSSGVTMTTGHRFNGNSGSTYYSVGDIVDGLKRLGLFT